MDLQTNIHANTDGSVTFERVQDCVPILERAKAMHNEGLHGSSDMKLAASIPNVIIERYCNDNNILYSEFCTDKAHMRRLLNDPALAHFRIWKGRL